MKRGLPGSTRDEIGPFALRSGRRIDRSICPQRIGAPLTHTHDEADAAAVTDSDERSAALCVGASAALRAAELDRDSAFPEADIAQLHRSGLLLAPFPTAMGGSALGSDAADPTRLMDILVAVGRGSLSLGRLYEGHVNAVKLVMHYGNAANVALLLDEARQGGISGVWMAEDGAPLRLEVSPDGTVLQGRKILASGSGSIRRPLLAARSDAGSIMVIPRIEESDRVCTDQWTVHGMRATATGTVDFSGIRVGKDEIVGKPDDYMTSPLFRGGAWRVIAVQLGGVEAVMQLYTSQLASSRGADHPLQLARLGEALIAVETARLWVGKACRTAEAANGKPEAIDAYVDLARNAFEQAALRVIACAQKAIGLRAFTRPNSLERVIRDLTTYMRQPGLDGSLMSAAKRHLHRHAEADA